MAYSIGYIFSSNEGCEELDNYLITNHLTYLPIEVDGVIKYQICEYNQPTEEQIAKRRIRELKANLKNTDYKAIKFAEGEITCEDYSATKTERQSWRKEINELQKKYNIEG